MVHAKHDALSSPRLVALLLLLVLALPAWGAEEATEQDHGHEHGQDGAHGSRLTDVHIPLQVEAVAQRPKPLLELGEPFLGTGTLHPGYRLPTGAVWQPSLLLFGTFRTALQSVDLDLDSRLTEWASRLDLFANLQLSGSERLVVGVRALDQDGRFTSYFFESPDDELEGELQDELNADLQTLYFEGDFGEIFPDLDRQDFASTDIGFSVGRQPLLFQEGLLINDTIDGIGLTRNTLLPVPTSNFRATFFFGWNNLDTSFGVERDGRLYALLTSTDLRRSTVDFDVAYVQADDDQAGQGGDLLAGGLSAVQRIGRMNSSFRILGSYAVDDEIPGIASDGALLFSELSWVPHHTHDLVYVNSFLAIDDYSPAARGVGPVDGGPLGRAGISFASVDLGSIGALLSSRARDVFGGAVGYQRFFDHTRKQLIVELGARVGTDDAIADAYGVASRYQAAFGRRFVMVVDGFVGRRQPIAGDDQTLYGGRLELVVKF